VSDNGKKRIQEFVPGNDLEKKLARIGRGKTTFLKGFNFLLNSLVVVLMKPAGDGESPKGRPLTLRGPEGNPLLAMFSSPARASEVLKHHKAYTALVRVPGWQVISALPADRGLVVNPGWPVGFTVLPEEMQKMRRKFRLESK
jgi:hypothetical protein